MPDSELKRTPLSEVHRALGGRMVPYAGYEMPVQYPTGILAEHQAVRTGVGLFDVSHMGQVEVTGPDRNAFVNRVTCNDVTRVQAGGVQYTGILTPEGTFVDDCTLYRFDDKWMVVVNAANTAAAWKHLVDHKGGANIRLKDISGEVGLLAVQGPGAEALLQPLTRLRLGDIAYYRFDAGPVAGVDCFISRTGYTGEDGFELYCRDRSLGTLWSALTTAGAAPIGLGARDSLRLEMGYALYGHEIDRTITPLEAGLGWIVKLDKGSPFVGDAALRAQKQRGVMRKLVGFRLEGRGIPRQGSAVWHEGRQVDVVRSGAMSPSLGVPIGTTFLPVAAAVPGTRVAVEIRGERVPAVAVQRPFWTRGTAGTGRRPGGQAGGGCGWRCSRSPTPARGASGTTARGTRSWTGSHGGDMRSPPAPWFPTSPPRSGARSAAGPMPMRRIWCSPRGGPVSPPGTGRPRPPARCSTKRHRASRKPSASPCCRGFRGRRCRAGRPAFAGGPSS